MLAIENKVGSEKQWLMLLLLVMVSPYKGITVLLRETRSINQCLQTPAAETYIYYIKCWCWCWFSFKCWCWFKCWYRCWFKCLCWCWYSFKCWCWCWFKCWYRCWWGILGWVTQGKIRGPDIIESRVAPQTITTTLYSIQCIRLLILQLQLPLLLLLLCKLPTTALRKASPLSYSVTVIERVLTSTREQFSKNTKTSAGQKVSRFSFP